MQGGQIAPGFTPLLKQIIHRLRDEVESYVARWIYIVVAVCFPVEEDFDTEGAWAEATVRASKQDIIDESEVPESTFYRVWPQLLESGLVVENDDGSIGLPVYKLKKYDVFSLRLMDERLARLEKLQQDQVDPDNPGTAGGDTQNRPENEGEKREKSAQKRRNSARNAEKTPIMREKTPIMGVKTPESGVVLPTTSFLKDLKDKKLSLSSRNIVSGFYRGIGQQTISRKKRERANKIFKELRQDGFTVEQIAFAVGWTLENAKEQPYDFSIIEHTIGQAIAAKEKEEAESREIEERERKAQEEREQKEREEKEGEEIEAHKESLDPDQRAELREKAIAEISESGDYEKEFVNDFIIGLKENEILRRKFTEENGVENESEH